MVLNIDKAEEYADELYKKFSKLAPWVVAELLEFSYGGYDYDGETEIPYLNKVKTILIDKYNLGTKVNVPRLIRMMIRKS